MATRRRFIRICSSWSALLVAARSRGAEQRCEALSYQPDPPSLPAFSKQLLSDFLVQARDNTSQTLRLVVAERSGISSSALVSVEDARSEKFRLVFCGPAWTRWTQDTYRFTHSTLGSFDLFIVPVGSVEQQHVYYEAVFNRPYLTERGNLV